MRLMTLSLLLLACSTPAVAKEVAVLFVLDASGSMKEPIEGRVKMDVAKESLKDLLPAMSERGFHLGLCVYAHRTGQCDDIEQAVPMGKDNASRILQVLAAVQPKGSTPLARAIKEAGTLLIARKEEARQLIVLTDGLETCGGSPVAEVQKLRSSGVNVTVHVIGFDVKEEAVQQLLAIARAGGGTFHKADSAKQLAEALRAIKKKIEMEVLGAAEKRAEAELGNVWFQDKFDRKELGADWKVLDPDAERWTLDKGLLVITRLAENKPDEKTKEQRWHFYNTLELQKELPQDWEIVVEWEAELHTRGECDPGRGEVCSKCRGQTLLVEVRSAKTEVDAGFRQRCLAQYEKFPRKSHQETNLERNFRKIVGSQDDTVRDATVVSRKMKLQKYQVRLLKKGLDYQASTRVTGDRDWLAIKGTHKVLRMPGARLRIYQFGSKEGYTDTAAEIEARIKSVMIREVK